MTHTSPAQLLELLDGYREARQHASRAKRYAQALVVAAMATLAGGIAFLASQWAFTGWTVGVPLIVAVIIIGVADRAWDTSRGLLTSVTRDFQEICKAIQNDRVDADGDLLTVAETIAVCHFEANWEADEHHGTAAAEQEWAAAARRFVAQARRGRGLEDLSDWVRFTDFARGFRRCRTRSDLQQLLQQSRHLAPAWAATKAARERQSRDAHSRVELAVGLEQLRTQLPRLAEAGPEAVRVAAALDGPDWDIEALIGTAIDLATVGV